MTDRTAPLKPAIHLPDSRLGKRQPKGDHNRRLSLGIDVDHFAAEAGIQPDALREYEQTGPGRRFDARLGERIGEALDRLESVLPNSQTGRLRPSTRLRAGDVGQIQSWPALRASENPDDWQRYCPGDGM